MIQLTNELTKQEKKQLKKASRLIPKPSSVIAQTSVTSFKDLKNIIINNYKYLVGVLVLNSDSILYFITLKLRT